MWAWVKIDPPRWLRRTLTSRQALAPDMDRRLWSFVSAVVTVTVSW